MSALTTHALGRMGTARTLCLEIKDKLQAWDGGPSHLCLIVDKECSKKSSFLKTNETKNLASTIFITAFIHNFKILDIKSEPY